MRNGSSETVSEFRSRWANAMISAQQKTPEISRNPGEDKCKSGKYCSDPYIHEDESIWYVFR